MTPTEINRYTEETWKAIPDFLGYEVSNQGRVRSFHRTNSKSFSMDKPQRILKPVWGRSGYLVVRLFQNNRGYDFRVHRLVLSVFISPCPLGSVSRHLDGNRANNYLSNLRWGSHSDNVADKKRHGTFYYAIGEGNGQAKLKDIQIRQVRDMVAQGCPQRKIAKIFDISQGNISHIVSRRTWRHI